MFVKDVTKIELGNAIKEGKGIQLLNFHSPTCGPCIMMSPVLRDVANKLNIQVYKVDVTKDNNFAREYMVTGTPTTFIFKDGRLITSLVGFQAFEQIKSVLENL
ncbi:thioredoxin family protein [Mesomycoplasma neurolyticum]|uniref:Thioredoxin n=1 Tax=Mesomycoplasma neurolyticum TaxID=2120 RepID=A0A449A4H4_9BACT|nr:thioredoxin family protein [Mesomycoplasma neurolyticum]VEU59139.1 thioredoxin [Mesomycoplasma neurolyticum]